MPEQASFDSHALRELRDALADILLEQFERVISTIQYQAAAADFHRAAGDSSDPEDPDNVSDLVDDALDRDTDTLKLELQQPRILDPLTQAFLNNARKAEAQIGITWHLANQYALAYARERAAELVGMRYDPVYGLRPNPNAKWRITDSTREDLKRAINDVMQPKAGEAPPSYRDLKQAIQEHPSFPGLFGEYRAEMIARSELAVAANAGTVGTFHAGGIERVFVLDNPTCPTCKEFAYTIQTLAWAKANPLQHPNCTRAFNAIIPGIYEPTPGQPG